MFDNYSPWDIKIDEFPNNSLIQQVRFLINFAVLAPSSHNSQPWRFSIDKDSISIFPEWSRSLSQSDQNNRQLYISLGCAIQNILIAANYYGFEYSIEYLLPNECVAKINLKKTRNLNCSEKDHLIFSITKRTNNRNKYKKELPKDSFFQEIKSLENENLRIDIVTDRAIINKIADVAIAAGVAAMEDVNFRRELSNYVKSNFTKSKFGMPGFGLGIPTLVSFIAPLLLRWVNINKLSQKADRILLKEYTPTIVVISTRQDNILNWLEAGKVFEYIALLSEKENIKTAIWAAPIQIGEYYRDLQKVTKTDFRPQVFFRLGYAEKATLHSPREIYHD